MIKAYKQLTKSFNDISPYELKHLTGCILCKLEGEFEEKLCGCTSGREVTLNELKSAITEAMLEIRLELRHRELQVERMKLNEEKVLLFADRKIVA